MRYFAHDLPVLTAAKLCGLNYRTVPRLCELVRQRVVAQAVRESPPLGGEVEIDESDFGPRRVRGKRGRGAGGKIPVIGLHKRGENVCLSVVKNCSKAELMPIITGRVLDCATPQSEAPTSTPTAGRPATAWCSRATSTTAFIITKTSSRGAKTTSTGSKAFGATPSSASSSSAASARIASSSTSRNANGASIIAALNFTHCSFRSSAKTLSQLHKTLAK